MAASEAVPGLVDDATAPEAVSEWAVLWAMISIVFYAMIQVSFTGYLWNDQASQGSLWPHRSSPFVCLTDGYADTYLIFRKLFTSHGAARDTENEEEPMRQNGALTKLALFSLGVLPQAIKLFTMRGIFATQVIAAMYLVPSVLGLFRSLISTDPAGDIDKFLESLTESTVSFRKAFRAWTVICGGLPHLIGSYVLWYRLADRVGFSASRDVVNAVDWIHVCFVLVCMLYLAHHMIYASLLKKSPMPFFPTMMVLLNTNLLSVPDLVAEPGQAVRRGITGRWQIAYRYMASFALVCYLVSNLVHHLAEWTYRPFKFRRQGTTPDSSTDPTAHIQSEPNAPLWVQTGAALRSLTSSWFSRSDVNKMDSEDAGDTGEQQAAAEEGGIGIVETGGPQDDPAQSSAQSEQIRLGPGRAAFELLTKLFFHVVVWSMRLILGVVLTFAFLARMFPWLWWQITKRYPIKILVNALGLFNLSMVALYYLVLFDAQGTSAPAWAEILG